MQPTTAFPIPSPPPAPAPVRSWALSDEAEAVRPPTLRPPARPPAAPPDPLAVTPPPTADLRMPASDWGSDGEAPSAGRRGPRVGDTVHGFKLVGELGRGAFARVYLAHQKALAGRPVALKVTFRPTREAERLARLQHTNVVPVYSVHQDGAAQIICMPYLGRTTIADLIRAYRVDHPSRRAGRGSTRAARSTAVESGKSRPASKATTDSNGRPGAPRTPVWTWAADGPPPIVGDPVAVLELLDQLAAGLSHAHDRGILHLDLKPANVLLADTGEPMLLDFNLSFDATRPDRDMVGGTMPYMAIEQLLDMRSRGTGAIDARADLYALGVMAFEMLTGAVPFATDPGQNRDIDGMVAARRAGPPALRPLNPDVTPAVEAIVRKLLAPEPDGRYQTAEDLRTDVRRHLNDLPLRFARDASARERFGKWWRRNRGLPLRMLAACFIGLSLGLMSVARERSETAARGAAVEQAQATRSALGTTRLDLILPGDPKAQARGAARATELLARYGLPADADWRKRSEVRTLPAVERAALADDLGELLFLLAHAKWQLAEGRPDAERRAAAAEAWKLNALARACFADAVPAALNRQAAILAPVAGEAFEPGAAGGPSTDPRHLFFDAVEALAAGRYSAALPLFDKVVAAQPGHAAAQFALAYCRQQLGQYSRAVERYDVARVLLPADPRPAHHRGLIYGLSKKPAQAEAEFSAAIELAPDFAEAYRHRALARYRVGGDKLADAEADLDAALKRGAPPLFVHSARAAVRAARGDDRGAATDRAAAKDIEPRTEQDFIVRGWSRMKADPKGALADFRKAAEFNPRSLLALQNQVHVLADELHDDEAALAVAAKAAEWYPEFAPALAGRAVLLARLKRRDDAHKEIAKARLLSEDAEVLYTAACVFARTSVGHQDDGAEAVKLLRRAIRDGYSDLHGLSTDPDLDPIRGMKEFKELEQSAFVLLR